MADGGAERKPVRIQRKRAKGWRMPEGAVYVGRKTPWGNPYSVLGPYTYSGQAQEKKEQWSVADSWFFDTKTEATEFAVKAFRVWLTLPQQSRLRELVKLGLKGKDLACFCRLDQPCHADVLLELANA